MSKNVTIAGASYSAVPAIEVPATGGGTATFTDVSDTTAAASDVAQGKQFYTAEGVLTQGTASGGGSSAWTHLAHEEFALSTTSTSAAVLGYVYCDQSVITSDKIIYVRIRDMAGARDGYYIGSDTFFINEVPANGGSISTYSASSMVTLTERKATDGAYAQRAAITSGAYGIFPYQLNLTGSYAGRFTIRYRYSATYTFTIDGTYSIDVFTLDFPAGYPSPFAT